MQVAKGKSSNRLDEERSESCLMLATPHRRPATENLWQRNRGKLLIGGLVSFKIRMQVLKIRLMFNCIVIAIYVTRNLTQNCAGSIQLPFLWLGLQPNRVFEVSKLTFARKSLLTAARNNLSFEQREF
jgi:hypothetical protein